MITWTAILLMMICYFSLASCEKQYAVLAMDRGVRFSAYVPLVLMVVGPLCPTIWFLGWVLLPAYGIGALPACGGLR